MRLRHHGALILTLTLLFATPSGFFAVSSASHHLHHSQATSRAPHRYSASTARRKGAHPSKSHRSNVHARLAQMQIDPTRVEDIQQALTGAGAFHGAPTGRWDSETRGALSRFQAANGFAVTGLPDAKSLMKLGLGPHPLPAELDKASSSSLSPETAPEAHAWPGQAVSAAGGEDPKPANPGAFDPLDKH